MDPTVDAGEPTFRDRPRVEWVRSWAPLAVASGTAALVMAGIAVWVVAGRLPGAVADVLFVLAIAVVISERGRLTDPNDCTGTGVSILGFGWATAVACGLVVSVQRATWVWGGPVSWWVHVLVALGIVALTGAVSWAAVLTCFLVDEDAAFLGASWGVLVGLVVAFSALLIGGMGIWVGMLSGGATALLAGPLLTALLRVRLIHTGPSTNFDAPHR